MVEMLAELPDLWDINARNYDIEIGSSRFVQEGALEEYVRWVKQVTSKPVVSTGRFTAPDTMVRQVREGVMDLIGAARPSIADPFLPRKLREGRIDDIRECIGCNICSAGDRIGVPIRCTQNPAMGEEWRRGWHPEWIEPSASERSVLVAGGGPAGLEAARALGQRGYSVTLAEASTRLGGRVTRESALPTLAEWGARARLARDPAPQAAERRDIPRQPARRRADPGVRGRPGRAGDRRDLAPKRGRAFAPSHRSPGTRGGMCFPQRT